MRTRMTIGLTALLVALIPGPARPIPAVPPVGTLEERAVAGPACVLYWAPGEPVGIWPHETVALEGRLDPAGTEAALVSARSWLRAGRPAAALERLAIAPGGPEREFLRLAALAELGRWNELTRPASASVPAGCGPLAERWGALAASAAGDPFTTADAFARLTAAVPELPGYVALWRLEAAALAGDVAAGEAAWTELNRSDVPRVARDDGRALLARLYERAGRFRMARQGYVALASESRGGKRAEHLLTAVRLAEAEGDRASADALRQRVVREIPARAAELVLDPGVRERLRIDRIDVARVLQAAGRPADAEPFATAALESGPDDERGEALSLRARLRAERGDREGAERDYAEFLSRWPTDRRAPEILYERARLALQDGEGELARRRWLDFVSLHPGHTLATASLYMAADSYQDDRTTDPELAERAIELFDRVAEHPGSRYADRAYMRAAHLLYALGRYREARDRYAAYRGSESSREARYWQARSAERLGDQEVARSGYRTLSPAEDYYALLARDRLAGGPGLGRFGEAGYRPGPALAIDPGASLLADPAGRRAAALLRFGERAYARAELERAVARSWGDRARLEAWAPALSAWGFPDLALRIGVRLGDAQGRLAYPRGFAAAVDAEARVHGLDAWLVLALIRQESLFDAEAVSPAGARGLMQVMPATGRSLAEGMALTEFDPGILDVPAVNLHLGASYMDARVRQFEAFWPAVLASYNAGPDAVSRWWAFPERRLDAELWVDRIPYRETRDYVKKVLAQYVTYRRLYDGGLTAR